jgi:Ran GTPase-activating protein (RanGAP) involved in mRNA processing and transport
MHNMTDAVTVNKSCLAGLKTLEQHGLLLGPSVVDNAENAVDDTLTSSWASERLHFDTDGYLILLDLGGKRLYKGFPCLDALALFSRLETLNIGGTDLSLWDIRLILNQIADKIQTLYLGGNGLGAVGAKEIADWLPTAQKLKKLDVRYNDIGPEGMAALCRGLEESPSIMIESLYVEGNQIGDEGATALSELLKKDVIKLKEVYLGSNQVKSQGAQQVASSLQTNKTVSKIYLEGNDIGVAGADAFSSVLEELDGNTALKKLFVDNNSIGKAGSNRLAQALKSDTTIGGLDMQD